MTPLIFILRKISEATRSRFMPEALFKTLVGQVLRLMSWLRSGDQLKLPAPGTVPYDILMDSYFLSTLLLSLIFYVWLLPDQTTPFLQPSLWVIVRLAFLLFLTLRVVEMVVRKVRAGLSGVSTREDPPERRARLLLISLIHAGELVLFLSAVKLLVVRASPYFGLSVEQLYKIEAPISPMKWTLVYLTIVSMTTVGLTSMTPLHWLTQILSSVDAVAGLGIVMAFFNTLFSGQLQRTQARNNGSFTE